MRITENFRLREFKCPCADHGLDTDDTWCHGQSWPHRDLVLKLQSLRNCFNEGRPKAKQRAVHITSGCRCPRYNAEGLPKRGYTKGAPRSQHIRGTAADIVVDGVSAKDVAAAARKLGLYAIEYATFTHVDIRNDI